MALSNHVPDSSPANVGDEWQWTIADLATALVVLGAGTRHVRVIDEQWTPADVVPGNESPIATVLRAVAIVAHHEIVIGGHEQRSPVVVRRLCGRWTEA